MKKTKSTFLEDSELTAALDMFVQFGILKKVKKNGEDAWVNNPDFDAKTAKEQQKIFDDLAKSTSIPNQILEELTPPQKVD